MALTLQNAGLDVILLESGGLDDEPNTQALYRGTMSGIDTWELDSHRWRLFGGSTSRWAGWCRPLDASDFAERPYIPDSGWPITLDDLLPYYARAHARVELADFLWDLDEMAAISGRPVIESPCGRLRTSFFQYSPPTRFGTRYRAELESAENVRVVLHSNVRNLPLESGLGRLSRFECATLQGVRFAVEARAFVLAMGGIENARVLLASNDQISEGVANSSGTVGRYFMEHPHYLGVSTWVLSRPTDLAFYDRHSVTLPMGDTTRRVRIQGVLGLEPEVLEDEGLLNFTASLSEAVVGPGETGPIDAEQVRSMVRDREDERIYQLNVRAEQSPRRGSRITLRPDDKDALGMPRVDLDWQVHEDDTRAMRRAMELIGSCLGAAGLGRVWTSTRGDQLSWTTLPGGHHMGTLRMTSDPERGVVDANSRCHDVDNLYISGSAVFTTGGASNPTLTIVALAERLADHLVQELG